MQNFRLLFGLLNPRTYKQSHTSAVVQGGGDDGTTPVGFCCVSIFRRDLAFGRRPLICSRRRRIYYGYGAARGLWRHPRWWPTCPPSWILPKIRIIKKQRKLKFFYFIHVKYNIIKHFAYNLCFFSPKEVKNTQFLSKNGMTTYFLWRHIS